jgi:hypothetical protein
MSDVFMQNTPSKVYLCAMRQKDSCARISAM